MKTNEFNIGKIFNNLTIVEKEITIGEGTKYRKLIPCICTCGKKTLVRKNWLRTGRTKSCGCLRGKRINELNKNHKNKQTCIICKKSFEYFGFKKQKLCSKECIKIHLKNIRDTKKRNNFDYSIKNILTSARSRAKKNKLEFNIDFDFIKELFNSQNKKCIKTGIEFELNKHEIKINQKRNLSPWTLSIDRIDNSKGYTKDNVQLVCLIYNIAKNWWNEKEVYKLATLLIKESKNEFEKR